MLSAVIQICDVQFDFDQETGGSYIVDEYVLEVGKSMDRSLFIGSYVPIWLYTFRRAFTNTDFKKIKTA